MYEHGKGMPQDYATALLVLSSSGNPCDPFAWQWAVASSRIDFNCSLMIAVVSDGRFFIFLIPVSRTLRYYFDLESAVRHAFVRE